MKKSCKVFLLLLASLLLMSQALAFNDSSFSKNKKRLTPKYLANFEKYYYAEDQRYILVNTQEATAKDGKIIFDFIIPSEQNKDQSLLTIESDLPSKSFRRYAALTFDNSNCKIKKVLFTEPKETWESFNNYPVLLKLSLYVARTIEES